VTRTAAFFLALLAAALLGATDGSGASAQNPKLLGRVGPGFSIALQDASGAGVTNLAPGTYDVEVSDQSGEHSFHLQGPGVDQTTTAAETGTTTWVVTFQVGTYVFLCNEHASTMRGRFTVGATPPPPPPPPLGTGAISSRTKLALRVGPGFTITLKTAAGKNFKSMRRGTYRIVVNDRSRFHNAHLIGPGAVDKKTGVAFVGRAAWRVKLAKRGTLRFLCDPHRRQMRGTKKIV
jgi:plastocyanin